MIKRVFCAVMLFTLVLASVGLSGAPVTAAPAAAATPAAPNANLMPPDTAIYFNFRAADLNTMVDFLLNTVQQVTGFRPGDPYADIDRGLSQFLGRDATFAKDVQSWLGDNISMGFRLTDKQLADLAKASASPSAMSSAFANPEMLVIVSVKDDTAGASFFKEVMGKVPSAKLTPRTETVSGEQITVYDQSDCTGVCGSLYEAKGYLAIGTTNTIKALLAMVKSGTPSLNSDATFGKLMKSLKPTNLFTAYLTPRLYQAYAAVIPAMMTVRRPGLSGPATETPAANAQAMLKSALAAIKGQAFAARMDGKVLAFDVAQQFDMNAVTKLYQSFGFSTQLLQSLNKPIQSKLAAQIPDKALAAVIGSNIPGLYNALQQGFEFGAKLNQQMGVPSQRFNADQIAAMFQTFQSGLKVALDLDLNTEVFSWMTGEFALYLTYNPDSMLNKVSKGSPAPFDVTMLIETNDAAKTRNFLTKLNAGLQKNAHVTIASAGTDLYTATTGDGLPFGYGLAKNTFVLSTGTGFNAAVAAVNGDGVLSKSTVWKNAQASMVNPTASVWLLNFTQWVPVVQAMTANASGRNDTKQALALLSLLESASISGGVMQPDGSSTASFQILLK